MFFDAMSDCEKRWILIVIAQLVRWRTAMLRVTGLIGFPRFRRHENFKLTPCRLLFESTSCDAESFYLPVCLGDENANSIY